MGGAATVTKRKTAGPRRGGRSGAPLRDQSAAAWEVADILRNRASLKAMALAAATCPFTYQTKTGCSVETASRSRHGEVAALE